MKLQYYIVVNVVIHISKSKGVAEMTNKTNKIRKKGGFQGYKFYDSYREVPMFSGIMAFITCILFHVFSDWLICTT